MKSLIHKTLVLLLLLSSAFAVATAQQEKNWMSISIGPAIPFNDFSGKTLQDSVLHSGFAKTGFSANLTYTRQLSNNFGITAMFSGSSNNTNSDALQKELNNIVERGEIEIGDFTASGDFGRWTTGMLVLGPSINFYLAHHFMMEIRGLIGVGMSFSPEYDYKMTLANPIAGKDFIQFEQQPSTATAFAWNVGLGFKYRFNRLFVRANLDYSGANFKYDPNIRFESPGAGNDYIDKEIRSRIQTDIMHITGGVGLLF